MLHFQLRLTAVQTKLTEKQVRDNTAPNGREGWYVKTPHFGEVRQTDTLAAAIELLERAINAGR